jgi:hypothetical protein
LSRDRVRLATQGWTFDYIADLATALIYSFPVLGFATARLAESWHLTPGRLHSPFRGQSDIITLFERSEFVITIQPAGEVL